MKKISMLSKTLATIFLVFLSLSAVFISLKIPMVDGTGESWLSGWLYRKSHVIMHPVGSPQSHHVVTTAEGTSSIIIYNTPQRKSFYYDDGSGGYYFVFYIDSNGYVYKTSQDSITWSSENIVSGSYDAGSSTGDQFSVFLDGEYVYIAFNYYFDATHAKMMFQRGTVSGNTISWTSAYMIENSTGSVHPTVTCDTIGRPFVAWTNRFARNSNADGSGTWTIDSTTTGVSCILLQMSSLHVYLSYLKYQTWPAPGGGYYTWYRAYGKEWSGSFGSEESINDDSEPVSPGYISGTIDKNNVIHYAYENYPSEQITYRNRTGGTWQSPVVLASVANTYGAPTIGIYDWDNSYISVVWSDGAEHSSGDIWGIKYTSAWLTPTILLAGATYDSQTSENSFMREYNGTYGILWEIPTVAAEYSHGDVFFSDILLPSPSSSNPGTGYQIKKYIHYGSGTSSGEDVYLNGHSKTDFSDIRFTASDGITLLSAWNESQYDGDNVTVWIKISDNLTSSDVKIYLYYGNYGASAYWDGDSTFIFFDDFPGSSIDTNKWSGDTAYTTVSGGICTLTATGGDRNIQGKTFVSPPYAMETLTMIETGKYSGVGLRKAGMGASWALFEGSNLDIFPCKEGVYSQILSNFVTGSYRRFSLYWQTTVENYLDNGVEVQGSPMTTVAWIATVDMSVWLNTGASSAHHVYCDWILLRKYVSPEPTNAVSGGEGEGEGGGGGWGGEEPTPTTIALTITAFPMSNSTFTYNGTSYITPQSFAILPGDNVMLVVLDTTLHVNCTEYYFYGWYVNFSLQNPSLYSTSTSISLTITGTTTVVIAYNHFGGSYNFGSGWVKLNSDGNFSADSATDAAYHNPHVFGDVQTWSISFNDYMTLQLQSNSTNIGHIASGTWYYNWSLPSTTVHDRMPLNYTYILDTDVRITNVNFSSGAWLRIAFAAAFCDRYNQSGHDVKYTELDIYDSPTALNSSSGDAAGGGNVIYQGQDVVEYRVANVNISDTWSHFTWNLTQYITSAWGSMVSNNEFKLESVYAVIEVIGATNATVDVDNFNLYVLPLPNSIDPYSYWDGVASEVYAFPELSPTYNNLSQWSTVSRNSSGYSVYATVRITNSDTPVILAEDGLNSYFVVDVNGTASLTLSDDTTTKHSGYNSLKMVGSRPDTSSVCSMNHTFNPIADWTAYDFLSLYIRFNQTDSYFHKIAIEDSNGEVFWWRIKDINNSLHNGQFNRIVIPLKRPEWGGSLFNLSIVKYLIISPWKSYENLTEASGWTATMWIDQIALTNGTTVDVVFNVPLGNFNWTLSTKRDFAGHEGQYVPAITYTGSVNADNFWVLRPRFDTTFGTWGLYNTTSGANNGITSFKSGSQGDYALYDFGDSNVLDFLYPTNLASSRKLGFALKLPPNDGFLIQNGTIEQEYVWGGISETKLKLYVESQFPIFGDANITNFDCINWIIAEKRTYYIQTNLTLPDGKILDTVAFNFTDVSGHNMGVYFDNITSSVGVFGYAGKNETRVEFLASSNSSMSFHWQHSTLYLWLPFWVKRYAVDTWSEDLGMFANDTLGEETGWFVLHSGYFNLYSQGGLEKLTTSGNAGRYEGGEFFNIFAGNDSYARSDIYWINLVHVKMLVTVDTSGLPLNTAHDSLVKVTFGIGYFDGISWTNPTWGPSVELQPIQSEDTAGDKMQSVFAQMRNNKGASILTEDFKTFWLKQDDVLEFWVDMWFNKANDSSIFGMRIGAYFYPMNNHDFWTLITGGTWGPKWKNETSVSGFAQLFKNIASDRITSHDIQMIDFWAKVSVQGASGENCSIGIKSIKVFDYTFGSDMSGIQTPSFDEPRTPSIPLGGIFGILASFLQGLANVLAPAFMFIWSGLVWIFDSIFLAIFGQPNVFTNFVNMIVAVVTTVVSFMIMISQYIVQFALVFSSIVTLFFTYFFSTIWGIFSFLFAGAFNMWTAIATIIGVSTAWLTGSTYVNGWGQTYNFTHMYNFTFLGLHGGIAIFMVLFVVGFFIQILRCLTTMSLGPIMEPVGLFWAFVQFLIKIVEFLFDMVMRLIHTVVAIAHALRDILPRPFGL